MVQHSFYAHGKLLLTSEYFVLDGAQAIALPTRYGQKMTVQVSDECSTAPILKWQALDLDGECWLDALFSLENFEIVGTHGDSAKPLQSLLKTARLLNPDFLRGAESFTVQTDLEFDRNWGLGSSSTMVSMVSEWADVNPFELLAKTTGGSGYDLACARSTAPILYHRENSEPTWEVVNFNPPFKDNLYFVYLNQKQCSVDGINHYRRLEPSKDEALEFLNDLSIQILKSDAFDDFEKCLNQHENFIARELGLTCVQEKLFSDYWGQVKSLGAWGGDFVLATSNRSEQETRDYFAVRGYKTVLNYTDMIL